jgi:hypothetical protein
MSRSTRNAAVHAERRGEAAALGIPAVRNRVLQMAAKRVVEPIFEADLELSSYGFRRRKRAAQAPAAIHEAGNRGLNFVVHGGIQSYFHSIRRGPPHGTGGGADYGSKGMEVDPLMAGSRGD